MLNVEKVKHKNRWPWTNTLNSVKYTASGSWPKISIITPSFNQSRFIEETILSILNQNYPNLEFVIIDGGSKDGTKEIIKKYASHLKYWVSEEDKGQVDAIFKGLRHCTGEIFNWINSDDLLAENSLFNIAQSYLINKKIKVIAGGCTHFTSHLNKNDTMIVRDLTFKGLISEKSYFQQPSQWLVMHNIKNLNIDPKLHYSFDWGMILNFDLKKEEIMYLSTNLSYFREHAEAKTSKASLSFQFEKLEIVKNYSRNTKSILKKIILSLYIFKLSRYLLVIKELESTDNSFASFLKFGVKSPSLVFTRFYLGYLKALFVEKNS